MHEFQDKVAVVTGAASGIGRAMAGRFAAEGMKVVLADIEASALARAEAELRAVGATVLAVRTDVRHVSEVDALAEQTLAAFGGVHAVCNNAGVVVTKPCWEHTLADWEWVLGVNLWGVGPGGAADYDQVQGVQRRRLAKECAIFDGGSCNARRGALRGEEATGHRGGDPRRSEVR